MFSFDCFDGEEGTGRLMEVAQGSALVGIGATTGKVWVFRGRSMAVDIRGVRKIEMKGI